MKLVSQETVRKLKAETWFDINRQVSASVFYKTRHHIEDQIEPQIIYIMYVLNHEIA